MSVKFYANAGEVKSPEVKANVPGADFQVLCLDGTVIPDCCFVQTGWLKDGVELPDLVTHESDEVIMFLGAEMEDRDNLNATVEIWLEHDKLELTRTCAVFIPQGVAHGKLAVRNAAKPVFWAAIHYDKDSYEARPALATAAPGTYSNYYCEGFNPPEGHPDMAPAGLLYHTLWIDSNRIPGAPYSEVSWFKRTTDEGPETHTHAFGEFLCFAGTNPDHPEELNGEVEVFVGGQSYVFTKSFLVFVPAGVAHCPFYIHRREAPMLHFSGGCGGNYTRE